MTNGSMLKEEIEEQILGFIRAEVVNDLELRITPHEDIIAKGFIDSMGIIRLIVFIQEQYGIPEINKKDMILDNFRTIGTIANLISGYIH